MAAEGRKPIRIWTDGCFDMMHYGHANALRQSKLLGDYLIVGVHSDKEIEANKGPPVMKEAERYKAVSACKWVDEVVENAPYVTQLELLKKYNIDYCVHGDDIITAADGTDCYQEVKDAGIFKTIPRTSGVSTTDLVGRMLLMTKSHHKNSKSKAHIPVVSPYTRVSKFQASTKQIVQFSEGRDPKPGDKIGYIDGAFDLFHVGHISILELAKKHCDYLIVGVHDDATVNQQKGENHPLSNLHERVLSVLSCRFVDLVIIGAPFVVTEELIKSEKINIVFQGSKRDVPFAKDQDPYRLARGLGVLKQLDSPSSLTTHEIVERILANRAQYVERNRKKEMKELQALEQQS